MKREAAHRFTLPRAVLARLVHFCAVADERPVDVVADAVALHLDELDERFNPGAHEARGCNPRSETSVPRPPDAIGTAPGGPVELRAAELDGVALSGLDATLASGAPPPGPIDLPKFLRRPS